MERLNPSTGSSPFVPARLQIARQARSLKQIELAALLDRSPSAISKWESADYGHAPDDDDLSALGAALRVNRAWFFLPHEPTENGAFFRSMRSELAQARDRVEARLYFFEAIFGSVKAFVDFPPIDVPHFSRSSDFRTIRKEDIERFASELRAYWGIGDDPIDHLLLLIENAGIAVGEEVFDSEKLDGISKWTADGWPMMLLARDKEVAVRRRFDAAHELGHLLMHRSVTRKDVADNLRLIEEQAMAFAGALLLPAAPFMEDTDDVSLDRLADLKLKWKTSIGAMIKRLTNLDLISDDYARTLWKQYSYREWRGFEPYDDVIEMERPENVVAALELLGDEAPTELQAVQSGCGLLAPDIIELTGVNETLFTPPAVIRRKLPTRSITSDSNVVPFPGRQFV